MNSSKYSILISLCIGIGLGLVVVFFMFHHPTVTQQVEVMPRIENPTPMPNEQALPQVNAPSHIAWVSPDGKKTLQMDALKNPENTTTYTFSVSDSATESGHVILTTTVDANTTMSIPFNTWSPGNQYFFVQRHTGTITESLVYKANGESFPTKKGEEPQYFVDVNAVFAAKKLDVNLRETTGWAAPTLLIINTDKPDLTEGPSYWLDISSKSVTRLSSTFP